MLECPVCEGQKLNSLFRIQGADVVECESCSMVFTPTPAPEFAAVYKASYFSNVTGSTLGYQNYRSEFTSHLVTFTRRLQETESMLGKLGRLLDVGCALGHLGEAARRRGWDVYVTDVSDYAVLESRDSFGVNGFVSPPHKLPVKNSSFDVITMYDVIEHLSHPLDLLKSARQALSSQGIIHIVTPNVQSWSARLMGRSWIHYKPDEHFLYFSPETIRSVLERCGFEVLKIKPAPVDMRLNDVLLRLERYSRWGVWFIKSLFRFLGVGDLRFKLYTGEMQIWARPAEVRLVTATRPVKDIVDIVCCPNCQSEIQLFEESEAICTQCELSFSVKSGVINFSKYAKRTNKQVVGSS